MGIRGPIYDPEQFLLGRRMGLPHFVGWNGQRIAEAEIVFAPARDMAIEELLKVARGPGGCVHAVGDRIDVVTGEHVLRYLAMSLGNPIDVMAEVEREVGHVQHSLAAEYVLHRELVARAKHAMDKVERKLIVTSRHRRMRGEDALAANGFYILVAHFAAGGCGTLSQQFQRQQAGVSFIHVKAGQGCVAECPQHPQPTHAQDAFLAQAVIRIAAVQVVRQLAVPGGVFSDVSVQEIDGHGEAAAAFDFVFPRADPNRSAIYRHVDLASRLLQEITNRPFDRFFGLPSVRIQALLKVPLAVKQRDGHHRNPQISCRADRIPGQDAQTATVGWHAGFKPDFHGEISNLSIVHGGILKEL